MPDFNILNEMYVDEEEFQMPEGLEEILVHENDLPQEDVVMVEEGAMEHLPTPGDYVPGSNTLLVSEDEADEQSAKDTDWEHDSDHAKFLGYFDSKVKNIPRHSGQTVLGCERAIAFLKSLLNELSKALRGDLDAKIDEQAAEDRYRDTQNMVDRLEQQIKKLKGSSKIAATDVRLISEGHCSGCNSNVPMWHDIVEEKVVCLVCDANSKQSEGIEKVAYTPRINVYVSPFERAIVGIMINSTVSAGKNIEETYDMLKNKYNFSPREELAIQQLVQDYGFAIFKDRARLNESSDPSSGNGIDFATNYHA